jgi:hypothetical protein
MVFLVSPAKSDQLQIAVGPASRFPKVSVCASTANCPLVSMQPEVKMTPEPLSTTPRLSAQNGTAEAFVSLQALAAGGRRRVRVFITRCAAFWMPRERT